MRGCRCRRPRRTASSTGSRGTRGPVVADSAGRFLNEGRFRASSAFDGSGSTAWVGELDPDRALDRVAGAAPVTVRRLRLDEPSSRFRCRPACRCRSTAHRRGPTGRARRLGERSRSLVRGRRFRLEILGDSGARRDSPSAGARARRAVGIGEIEGAGVPRMIVPRRGALHAACGIAAFAVGGRRVPLRVDSGVAEPRCRGRAACDPVLGAGGARLGERSCSPPSSGVFRIDWLRLRSPAPAGTPAPSGGGGVVEPGHIGRTSVTGVRVALRGRSWLVLGESYDRGWRASCDGRSLGSPVLINGYANGWSAPANCRAVSFTFAPQRTMVWLYALSAAAAIACLALLLFRRAPAAAPPDAVAAPAAPVLASAAVEGDRARAARRRRARLHLQHSLRGRDRAGGRGDRDGAGYRSGR